MKTLPLRQLVELTEWFRKNLVTFQNERPSSDDVMKMAENDLGFAVPKSRIAELRKEYGTWGARGGNGTSHREPRIAQVAAVVERLATELGFNLEPHERENFDRIMKRSNRPTSQTTNH